VTALLQATSEVTRHLPGDTSSYVYISSMAVLPTLRRKGIARAMLAAAEQQARLWQVPFLALHVYVNNPTACRLYESCGFQVVHTDPGWKAVFGGKVRLLMVKPL
jgi:ribosomal protein S18 acetylase RimI-like enzyme